MSEPATSTLAWENAPFPALIKLAWPIVVSMISVASMTLVDTLFVSRMGASAVAGVGLAGVLTFGLWCFPIGTLRAVKILVSHSSGAGQRQQFHPFLVSALLMAVVLGVLTTLLGVLAAPLLPKLTATAESGQYAREYLSVRVLGSVPFLLLIAIQETRQGFGDSRTMMFTTLLGNTLNICLDYVFIIRFGWGVGGAAWASNLALFSEMLVLGGLHFWREGLSLRGFGWWHVRRLFHFGLPSGIQFGMEVSSFAAMVLILSAYSETHTAAHQIAIQVLHFAFLPALAFSEAGSVLAGQAIGAGRPLLIATISKLTLKLAWAYASVCAFVLFFGASRIVSAFTAETELKQLTVNLFMIIALFQFCDAANLVARGLLRGIGDVRFVAVVGILMAWGCTPPLTYLLGYQLGWGVYGAWVGLSGEVVLVTLVLWRRLSSSDWQKARQHLGNTLEPVPSSA